ncbi:MAG TPA: hypothetical protein VI039_07520 [Solirubrobacterales bacterium]
MGWPPQVGELLPRVGEATGIREKLIGYSLNPDHREGGAKAHGFFLMLGIDRASVDHLESEIRRGIGRAPIASFSVTAFGYRCVVEFFVQGVGHRAGRLVRLRTVWQLASPHAPPRLLTAFLKP